MLSVFEESKGELRCVVYLPALSVTVDMLVNQNALSTCAANLDRGQTNFHSMLSYMHHVMLSGMIYKQVVDYTGIYHCICPRAIAATWPCLLKLFFDCCDRIGGGCGE